MVKSYPSSLSIDEEDIPINFNNLSNPETLVKILIGYNQDNVG